MTPPSGGDFSKGENMTAKMKQHYKSAYPGGVKIVEYKTGEIVEGDIAEYFIKKGVATLEGGQVKEPVVEDTFEIVEEKPKRKRRTRKTKKEE